MRSGHGGDSQNDPHTVAMIPAALTEASCEPFAKGRQCDGLPEQKDKCRHHQQRQRHAQHFHGQDSKGGRIQQQGPAGRIPPDQAFRSVQERVFDVEMHTRGVRAFQQQ